MSSSTVVSLVPHLEQSFNQTAVQDRGYLRFVTKQLEVEDEEECHNLSCAMSDDEQLCEDCSFCADAPSVCQRMMFGGCGHAVCRPCAREIRLVAGEAPVECPTCGKESAIVNAVDDVAEMEEKNETENCTH